MYCALPAPDSIRGGGKGVGMGDGRDVLAASHHSGLGELRVRMMGHPQGTVIR